MVSHASSPSTRQAEARDFCVFKANTVYIVSSWMVKICVCVSFHNDKITNICSKFCACQAPLIHYLCWSNILEQEALSQPVCDSWGKRNLTLEETGRANSQPGCQSAKSLFLCTQPSRHYTLTNMVKPQSWLNKYSLCWSQLSSSLITCVGGIK